MLNHKGTCILETTRLILRPFVVNDIEDMYYNWACDEEVTRYLTWKEHKDINRTSLAVALWVKSYNEKEFYNWVIQDKKNKKIMGSICLFSVDNYNENCEVGYCLGKKFWNKGIMYEALIKVIDFAFCEIGFERISARRHLGNLASGRVMKKCKFIYEGTLRNIIKDKEGNLVDCKYYSILKSDYIKDKLLLYRK